MHTYYFFKNMKKIVCGKENVAIFKAEFKAVAPDFFNMAKELYAFGMISGLRGSTLEFGQFHEQANIETAEPEKKAMTCEKCVQWQRDNVGDGTGIGKCLVYVGPTPVKWPGTPACNKFKDDVWPL
jgi:hypothetical protein